MLALNVGNDCTVLKRNRAQDVQEIMWYFLFVFALGLFSHSCREQKWCQSTEDAEDPHHPALSTPLGYGRWMALNRNVRSRKVPLFHRIRDEACVTCLTRSNDILQRWRLVRCGRRGWDLGVYMGYFNRGSPLSPQKCWNADLL